MFSAPTWFVMTVCAAPMVPLLEAPAACPFTITTGGGVASRTEPVGLCGTWRDSLLGLAGRAGGRAGGRLGGCTWPVVEDIPATGIGEVIVVATIPVNGCDIGV